VEVVENGLVVRKRNGETWAGEKKGSGGCRGGSRCVLLREGQWRVFPNLRRMHEY